MLLITITRIIQLSLLIAAGILAFRIKLIKRESIPSLNALLLNLALPALLLKSFQSDVLFNGKSMLLPSLRAAILLQALTLILPFLLVRKHPDCNVERASLIFTNNAFIAIPLLSSIFGDLGTFYACTYNAIASFVFFSVLPAMLTGGLSIRQFLFKSLVNDKVIVCVFSIVLLILDIHLPDFLMTPVEWLGDMSTPLSMVLIGCIIAYCDFKLMFNKRVVIVSLLRLIVIPLIVGAILIFIIPSREMLFSLCILSATPAAGLVAIYTEQAGGNTALASGIFSMTAIACAVTIPLIVAIIDLFV